jgi:uncharacterized membrane protein (UPF0127 family)
VILGNATRGRLLVKEVGDARGVFSTLRGLIGRGAPPTGRAFFFAPPFFHSFGTRDPVDVAFVDEGLRVLAVARSHPPRSLARAPEGSSGALVAAAGTFASGAVEAGDLLEWVPRTSARAQPRESSGT